MRCARAYSHTRRGPSTHPPPPPAPAVNIDTVNIVAPIVVRPRPHVWGTGTTDGAASDAATLDAAAGVEAPQADAAAVTAAEAPAAQAADGVAA